MQDASGIRWAPRCLRIFARATATLVLLSTLAVAYSAAHGAAFVTILVILPPSLAQAFFLWVARRTAIVRPLVMVPWLLVAALIGVMRHWPIC